MTERIDHVTEAKACEEAGLHIMRTQSLGIQPHMEAVMQFDLARLHAQLALVEQQRIANLISIYGAERRGEDGSKFMPIPEITNAAFDQAIKGLELS